MRKALEQAGYTEAQALEAAIRFLKTDTLKGSRYPYTLPFVWQNRTHYITAEKDETGCLILKRASTS